MDAAERVKLYRSLFDLSSKSDKPVNLFIHPDLENARVRLGTSVADYSLPYIIQPQLTNILDKALEELAYLFLYRNKDALGEEKDEFLLIDYDTIADSRPRSFMAPPTLKNPLLRSMLESAPQYFYMLDSGIVESWLGGNGRGRALMESWSKAYIAALGEKLRSDGKEETPYFLLWILVFSYENAFKVAEKLPVDAASKKAAAAALITGINLVHRFAIEQLLTSHKKEIAQGSRLYLCLNMALNFRNAFVSAPASYDLCSFYDVPATVLGNKAPELLKNMGTYKSFERLEHDLDKLIPSKKKIKKKAIKNLQLSYYRKEILNVLRAGLPLESALFAHMDGLLLSSEELENTLRSGKLRKEAIALIKGAAKEFSDNQALSKKLSQLAALFGRYSTWRPLKPLRIKEDEAMSRIKQSIAADLGDSFVASLATELVQNFTLKSGEESDRELGELYNNGKLYQFGLVPILKKARVATNVAHYFVDLKDYTNRTALLKEDVMGHFIREEFYEPILSIAKTHFRGFSHLEDKGGIYLNNLLGDAVSISGDVEAIVDMTRGIRQHLENYQKNLEKRQTRVDLAERIEKIKADYGKRLKDTEEKYRFLVASGGDNLKIKLLELKDHGAALQRDMATEIDCLTGQHLISGSFISFGASANVVTFDDNIWGNIKVSICEKINESARGTSRPAAVIAPFNQLLDLERKRLKIPVLKLPFLVYVGNSLGYSPAPDIELALKKAFLAGKPQEAYKLYLKSAQAHVKKTISGGIPGIKRYLNKGMAIYNAGDALSGEALNAYRKACAAKLKFVDLNMPVNKLEDHIRRRYAFFEPSIRLLVSINADNNISQIFHHSGSVTFKGFESAEPTEIWEMIDMTTGFGLALSESTKLGAWVKTSL